MAHFNYKRPSQVVVTNNYLYRSPIIHDYYWGAGEKRHSEPPKNIYRGNEIYAPPFFHLRFRTAAYIDQSVSGCSSDTCLSLGTQPIRADDEWDNNTYSTPFKGLFHADNVDRFNDQPRFITLPEWQSLTASAGNAFDKNAKEVPMPTGQKVVLLGNAYEKGRAHLLVFNYDHADGNVQVDLSGIVPSGWSYQITPVKDAFGTAVVSGTDSAAVMVPFKGKFTAYLVRSSGH